MNNLIDFLPNKKKQFEKSTNALKKSIKKRYLQ